jgi:hypothetical protein
MRLLVISFLIASASCAAENSVEQTIRGLYESSRAAARNARTREEMRRALDTFAPEWVGNPPAGETLTLADLMKEAESALAIPPEKRPMPQMDFVYIRETGWNVLVVYWNSRRVGNQVIGSLFRDTWTRTASGWKRIRQEKFFPDRPLLSDGKPAILPVAQ